MVAPTKAPAKRGLKEAWQKGQSGNPTGRPKGYAEFRAECQQMTPEVLKRLRSIAIGRSKQSVEAAKTILAYAWGKPTAVVDLNAVVKGDIAAILAARKAKVE